MTYEALLQKARAMDLESKEKNVLLPNARIMAFLLDNCEIYIPDDTTFFVDTNLVLDHDRTVYDDNMKTARSRILRQVIDARTGRLSPYRTEQNENAIKRRVYYGAMDLGHTAPDWETIFSLGLGGLKQRILDRTGPALNRDFVEAEVTVLEAVMRFARRAASVAREHGRTEMAEGLYNLATNPPRNLYEAFQLTLLYYYMQQFVESIDVRTLGRLDRLMNPFLAAEAPEHARQLTLRYIQEIERIDAVANMPFALGGIDETGKSAINPMSYVLLDAYKKVMPPNVKLHILCTPDMPEDFLLRCMDSIKSGANSLVFINDPMMISGLCKLGIDPEDARRYSIIGCYEAGARDEVPCTCAARVNMVKALEYALHSGLDVMSGLQIGLPIAPEFDSYEALYQAFCDNLYQLTMEAILLTAASESRTPYRAAAPLYSSTLASCVAKGGDAYSNMAARYNNSSLCAVGIGTVADSLYAIRHLVYDTKMLTLPQLIEILDSNWEGQEALRSYIRSKLPKYGNNDPRVDDIAVDVARRIADTVNGAPNGRGGIFRLGILSIDWRLEMGARTAATPDGRRNGETFSQNASATFGMDREGLTSHILSVAQLPGEDAVDGCVMDMELHSSAVAGENGTRVLLATLKTFFAQGGQTAHYNVLNADVLRDAQLHPEKYTNLQVRVCGWNADFTKMTKREQDEFIARAEMRQG